MLPNHAPLAVAERFGMLEALHPHRIDLGLGRAPGTDLRTALALRSTSPSSSRSSSPSCAAISDSGYGGMRAVAGEHTVPELWMLGSTDGGARIAAKLGLPFVFAHHFHPHFTEPALELYRGAVRAVGAGSPRRASIVAAGIVVGDDDEDALRRALPGGVSMLRLRQGRPAPIPSVEEAEAIVGTLGAAELPAVEDAIGRAIVGAPQTVHAQLLDLVERTGTDELMLTSQVVDADQRIAALERIAEAFELDRRRPAATSASQKRRRWRCGGGAAGGPARRSRRRPSSRVRVRPSSYARPAGRSRRRAVVARGPAARWASIACRPARRPPWSRARSGASG